MVDELKFKKSLPPSEGVLFWELRRGYDVTVKHLYSTLHPNLAALSVPVQQKALGAFFSRINKRLVEHGYRIAPGVLRNSYRMWSLEDYAARKAAPVVKKPRRRRLAR